MVSNLTFTNSGNNGSPKPLQPDIQPVRAQLTARQPADGSFTIMVPGDWSFAGAAGKVLTAAPGGRAGFVFTSIQMIPPAYGVDNLAQGVMASPYRAPSQVIPLVFSRLGHQNVQLLGSRPDSNTMLDSQRYFGRQCQAEDMMVSWVSREGAACLGAFKVINSVPSITGIWNTILAGFWGPQEDFLRWVPLLEQVGASFRINDQFALNYIQSGLANLRRLQEKTAQSMRELNQARYDNQAAWEQRQARKDASDARWDDYRRGQSYWVSELEGGKVYATDTWGMQDTRTGDYFEGSAHGYVHFEGQNPRHPSETMREVSSYEVQRLMQGRP